MKAPVVIDEIRNLPSLLDEVHRLIVACGWLGRSAVSPFRPNYSNFALEKVSNQLPVNPL